MPFVEIIVGVLDGSSKFLLLASISLFPEFLFQLVVFHSGVFLRAFCHICGNNNQVSSDLQLNVVDVLVLEEAILLTAFFFRGILYLNKEGKG